MLFSAEAMKGTFFEEYIFETEEHVHQVMPHLCKVELNPKKATKRLNTHIGRVVGQIHKGFLANYEEVSPERKQTFKLKGVGERIFFYTTIKVRYTDGFEGFTYRLRVPLPQ